MKTMAKGKRVVALAAAAVLAMGGGAIGLSTMSANAYTMDDVATLEARTPSSLAAMKTQGFRGDVVNPNFEDGSAIPRSEYGGPWSFTHQDELSGPVEEYSSYQRVTINDAVDGMGKTAGQGEKITTALEITINKDNQETMSDSLTYSTFDDLMYGEVNKEAFYFTAWVKAEQDMWFDVGISYGAKQGYAQVYWDLGRRFHVPANTWTQIGLDGEGNYLPFRAKVTTDGYLRGTGSDPTAANSNCVAEPDETKGDTKIGEYYRDGWGEVWACMRLYAYSGETYNATNGVGAPATNHGLEAGDKYLVTGMNFWHQSAPAPTIVKYVSEITLNKTTLSLEEGKNETLTATVAPADADDKTLYWYSSDETIATVDENGKVTAVKEGTVTITAEANDGNGAEASCAVTVTKKADTTTPGGDDNKPGDNKPGEEKPAEDNKGGCAGSVAGFGALGLVSVGAIAAVTAIVIKRKKEN